VSMTIFLQELPDLLKHLKLKIFPNGALCV
jgi:hypothetical protein